MLEKREYGLAALDAARLSLAQRGLTNVRGDGPDGAIEIDTVAPLPSLADPKEIVVVLRHALYPGRRFGLRFPAYGSPEDRANWTPDEWADLLGSDLQGLLETRDLSKAPPDEIYWLT
jgi:hypothetical protein